MSKKKSVKKYPKKRPKPLYAYVSRGSKVWAVSFGSKKFGSISAYIDQLIKKDMVGKARSIVKKARKKK